MIDFQLDRMNHSAVYFLLQDAIIMGEMFEREKRKSYPEEVTRVEPK